MKPSLAVGFTGTREGLTHAQYDALYALLCRLSPSEAHHGDCVGSDAEFHGIVRQRLIPDGIVIHPPTEGLFRARCRQEGNEIREPKPYLVRNRDLVDETDVLIACPREPVERLRSGTWSTVRYARTLHRPIYLVLPDGKVMVENVQNERHEDNAQR